jgi:hypothetical protein
MWQEMGGGTRENYIFSWVSISEKPLFPEMPEGKLPQLRSVRPEWLLKPSYTTTREEDDMITQGIKRWLYKLFAWWPWKQTPETSYQQAVSNLNMSMAQETMARTVDGSLPQPGITSVVVEQEKNTPATPYSTNEGLPDQLVEQGTPLSTDEPISQKHNQPTHALQDPPDDIQVAATQEQKLAFLRYLVQKGQVNEGFEKGQTPEQYRKRS